jgi:hypothetical protein
VNEPEEQIRRLVGCCGLEFEEACLNFHRTDRPVVTASATQVRRKMYTSSIGRWRNYEKYLQPLISTFKMQSVGINYGFES